MKRTPWFPADILPVHVGWYEVRYAASSLRNVMKYWSGRYWEMSHDAARYLTWSIAKWRGIKK